MRYWWVNQNQIFRQEIEGGYLWSPKRNKNGHRNPFYERYCGYYVCDGLMSDVVVLGRNYSAVATTRRSATTRCAPP